MSTLALTPITPEQTNTLARLDFTERVLAAGRQRAALQADTPPEPVDASR